MNSIGRARAELRKRMQAYQEPAYKEVHIWREPPIALDEWLVEVSDAREWDRHSVRVGRVPSTGMAIPLKPGAGAHLPGPLPSATYQSSAG